MELYHAGPIIAILPPYTENVVPGAKSNVAKLASAAPPTTAAAAGVVALMLATGIVPPSVFMVYPELAYACVDRSAVYFSQPSPAADL